MATEVAAQVLLFIFVVMVKRLSPMHNLHEDHVAEDDQETLDLLECRTETATLSVSAKDAFSEFAKTWVVDQFKPLASSVEMQAQDEFGRATVVAFIAETTSVPQEYVLDVQFKEGSFRISWNSQTGKGRSRFQGFVQFTPLTNSLCLMQYELAMEIPSSAAGAGHGSIYGSGAVSSVVSGFRDLLHPCAA